MDEREEDTQLELISVDELLEVNLPEADFEVRPGKTMRLRALSRAESIRAQKMEDNRQKQEAYLLATAVLKPVLTEDTVTRWQKSAAFMEVERVARKINELSGIGQDAAKSDLSEDGAES